MQMRLWESCCNMFISHSQFPFFSVATKCIACVRPFVRPSVSQSDHSENNLPVHPYLETFVCWQENYHYTRWNIDATELANRKKFTGKSYLKRRKKCAEKAHLLGGNLFTSNAIENDDVIMIGAIWAAGVASAPSRLEAAHQNQAQHDETYSENAGYKKEIQLNAVP